MKIYKHLRHIDVRSLLILQNIYNSAHYLCRHVFISLKLQANIYINFYSKYIQVSLSLSLSIYIYVDMTYLHINI